MAEQTKSPLDAHAIELITALAFEGAEPSIVKITTEAVSYTHLTLPTTERV
nr:hypothetical protein 12 [Spirochaetaceae bacterium]